MFLSVLFCSEWCQTGRVFIAEWFAWRNLFLAKRQWIGSNRIIIGNDTAASRSNMELERLSVARRLYRNQWKSSMQSKQFGQTSNQFR